MIGALTTMCMILLLFVSGHIIECIKRIIMLIINCTLKILDFCGISVFKREINIKTSKDFKNTFKEIKVVKKSKQNSKLKPSINLFALIVFLFSAFLIIIDLDIVSNGTITTWLYNNTFLNKLVPSQSHMDVAFVAVMFSIISFAISKLLNLWKETKENRKTRKQLKLKDKAFKMSSSKELLDAAKIQDAIKYENLKLKRGEDQ